MKKILVVCEAFGGGVFTYVSQLCNDMVNDFIAVSYTHLDVYKRQDLYCLFGS